MKFGKDTGPCREFEDDVTALIDGASNELTCAEMVGILELQLHILKTRMTLPLAPKPKDTI